MAEPPGWLPNMGARFNCGDSHIRSGGEGLVEAGTAKREPKMRKPQESAADLGLQEKAGILRVAAGDRNGAAGTPIWLTPKIKGRLAATGRPTMSSDHIAVVFVATAVWALFAVAISFDDLGARIGNAPAARFEKIPHRSDLVWMRASVDVGR
jgi:hypothetical protein